MQNFFWLFVEMVLQHIWVQSHHLKDVLTSITNLQILLISLILTLAAVAKDVA